MRTGVWALVATLAIGVPSAYSADAGVGTKVYGDRCAACHGESGGGDGPAAMAIAPPPRNFRDAGFWQSRTTEQITTAVRNGRPGTMMSPFAGTLSDAEIDAVVAYLATFRPAGH